MSPRPHAFALLLLLAAVPGLRAAGLVKPGVVQNLVCSARPPASPSAATAWIGCDRHLGRGWSGRVLPMVVVAQPTRRRCRDASPLEGQRAEHAHPADEQPQGRRHRHLVLRERCLRWYSTTICHWPWGHGTEVAVSSGRPTARAVFPISSCCGSTQQQPVVGCLATGYSPGPVTFSWSGASGATSVTVPETHGLGPDKRASFLRPPHAGAGDIFTCSVNQQATRTSLTQNVEGCVAGGEPTPPEVQVLHSSACSATGGDSLEFLCVISGFSPATVEVEWLVNGVPGLLVGTLTSPRRDAGATTYTATSRTNVSLEDWKEGKAITCQVKHPATGTKAQDHSRFCPGPGSQSCSPIQIFVVPPSPGGLYVRQDAKIHCVVVNLPSDASLSISWTREKSGVLRPDPMVLSEHFNSTFTASSSLAVSTQDWVAGERFTCTVQHEDLPEPISKSISKHAGKVTPPHIFTFPPHAEEMALAEVTLTCRVRGFQPENVEVQWLRNHNSVPATEFVTTPPLKEANGDGTFFLYSKMTVPKASWQGGVSYACMVVHEGLPMRFTQRPLQKTPGK
uniref:7.8S IgY heavy chain n=3 Tax=Anser anser TaxID=8843 RepID=A0A024B6A7_9AVES|nr:7.8S IgY heavy chain [Anser anser]